MTRNDLSCRPGWRALAAAAVAALVVPALAGAQEAPALSADTEEWESGAGLDLSAETAAPAEESTDSMLSLSRGVQTDLALPNQADALQEIQDLIDRNQFEEALQEADELLEWFPFSRAVHVTRAVILSRMYRYEEALDLLGSLRDRFPEDAAIKNNMAWLYATADDPNTRNGKLAVELAQEALLQAPGSYHIWSTVAEGYYVSGNYEKALGAAREAMRMAIRQKASSDNLREYRNQVRKSYRAVHALSLLD